MTDPKPPRGSVRTYWHFAQQDRRLGYGDGRKIRVGETLWVEGTPKICEHGLHASKRLIDTLGYAHGPILCKVRLLGALVHSDDKSAAQGRHVLAMADVSDILRDFTRRCAMDVIHLWDAPEAVVRYLKTGDEAIRDAARVAAWDAARDAARVAAWDAARDAARAEAWIAARAEAWIAARAAARDAARAEARAAARAEAWNGAWVEQRDKQNRRLVQMVRSVEWEGESDD